MKWIVNAKNQTEFKNRVSDYLKAVKLAKQLYQDIQIPIEGKDRIIVQLSNLQIHLTELNKAVSPN